MANKLPPTQPAPPAQAALLDQEDLDELAGHMANLENAANEATRLVLELRRRADEANAWVQVQRGIAKRVRALLAERAEATR